jgi:hypothetical protein
MGPAFAPFCAAAVAQNLAAAGDGGWWRAAGGLALVFGLLLVCLRLLRRWPRPRGAEAARLEAIWPLGPRREIHLVRLGDEIHYVYRNEQGLVLLRHEPWVDYRAAHAAKPVDSPRPAWLKLLRSLWPSRFPQRRLARPGVVTGGRPEPAVPPTS